MGNYSYLIPMILVFLTFPCSFIAMTKKKDLDGEDCALFSLLSTMVVGIILFIMYVVSR